MEWLRQSIRSMMNPESKSGVTLDSQWLRESIRTMMNAEILNHKWDWLWNDWGDDGQRWCSLTDLALTSTWCVPARSFTTSDLPCLAAQCNAVCQGRKMGVNFRDLAFFFFELRGLWVIIFFLGSSVEHNLYQMDNKLRRRLSRKRHRR